jgi:hypothetical protein
LTLCNKNLLTLYVPYVPLLGVFQL